jgi:hypothetical protein
VNIRGIVSNPSGDGESLGNPEGRVLLELLVVLLGRRRSCPPSM